MLILGKKNKLLNIIIIIFFFFSFRVYAEAVAVPNLPVLPPYQDLLLTATVNQEPKDGVILFLLNSSNQVLANQNDLKAWRVKKFPDKSITYEGEKYYLLNDFPGLSYVLNTQKLTINITLPFEVFEETDVKLKKEELVKPTPSSPGGYINYDFTTQRVQGDTSSQGLFWETAFFNKYGVGISDFVTTHQFDRTKTTRLNTNWTHDDPEKMRSFIFGDSFSSAGPWGGSVGFEGFQVARNFGTQPSYITFPLPSSTGRAVLPTTVDLFVNNAMVSSQSVAPGPFSIQNIPIVTGQGNVTVVTTDILGHQQTITLPFYGASQILKKGLHNYSFEAGPIRRDFGSASNHYSSSLISGTDNIGITDDFTFNWHAEALSDNQQTAGIGANFLFFNLATISTAVADSHSRDGNGKLFMFGFQRQAYKKVTYGGSITLTSPYFAQAATQEGQAPSAMQSQVFVGIPLFKGNSLGLSFTAQNNRGSTANTRLATASYSFKVYKKLSCSLSALSNVGGARNKAGFMLLTMPLGASTNLSSGFNVQSSASGDDNTDYITNTITKNLPQGPGWGYSVSTQNGVAGTGDQERYQTQLNANSNYGSYSLQANRSDDSNAYQFETKGSAVFMDKQLFFSRQITQSFGVVDLQDLPGIDVYAENQLDGKTNKKGYAIVPDLRPYQNNSISIKAEALPVGAQLNTDKINVVPYYRSGVSVRFPVKSGLGATMKVVDDAGQILPSGTLINFADQKDQFMVADDGQVFVSGVVDGDNKLEAKYNGKTCIIEINYKKSSDPLPDLGTVTCKGAP